MAFESLITQVVTQQISSVLHNNNTSSISCKQRISGLYVIVDNVAWQDTALTLWEVESWKLINTTISIIVCRRWVIDVKDTSSKTRSHFTAVISIHTERSTLGYSFISA